MTGVLNRRAGFKKLAQLQRRAAELQKPICVCFLDINGLKEVNDTLGHDAGDELILSAVNGIKHSTREDDIVARLGGDEFLIVFWDVSIEKAELIWERIHQFYDQINESEGKKYLVSVSHGIEEVILKRGDSIDAAVNRADEKMYAEKRMLKKNLQVIRDGR